jgi:integrase
MILLLTTYGLRGIEVIRLNLDDIDWRKNLLHIRARKAGNNTVYPLASSVAYSIIEYLRRARPNCDDRSVFLSVKAPYRPLVYSQGLGYKIRKYMRNAGVNVPRPGSHTFRYSCAQSLLTKGTPLKIISDYIGHSHPETTQQYLKIAVDDLRVVALAGEEVVL